MRPGVNVTVSTTPPTRSAPTDTGVWFVAGLTEKGSIAAPVLITSMADYVRLLGARVSYGYLYDSLELFFREGGSEAYVGRVVGVTPVNAFLVLNDGVAAATLRVEALNPGDWGNSLRAAVLAPLVSGFRLQVSHITLGILETSPDLVDKAAAFTWAAGSAYIKLIDQASALVPAVLAATFAATV